MTKQTETSEWPEPEVEQVKNKIEGIGKTLEEFKKLHPKKTIRVTSIGDTQFMGTCDFRTDRINVSLSAKGLVGKTVTHKFEFGDVTETTYD